MDKYKIPYFNMIIRKFAERYNLSLDKTFNYLYKYGGIKYLVDYYHIEHLLPVDDTLDELVLTCRDAGGGL